MFPRIIPCLTELQMQHGSPLRSLRFVQQLQARLARRAVAFATIARYARAHDIFPRSLAAPIARNDVIEIEIFAVEFMPAVLAGVVVALKDVVARKLHFLLGHPIEKEEQDHLGHANGEGDRAHHIGALIAAREAEPLVERHGLKRTAVGLHDLGVALIEKHERALDAADVDRLPETIEHEDVVAQDRFHGSLSVSKGEKPSATGTLGYHVGQAC
jgi:hypothetical protein